MNGILFDQYRYKPPLASQFATINGTNSQSPTATDTTGRGLVIAFGTSPAAGDNVRTILKPKTTLTTTYSIIARIATSATGMSAASVGLALWDGTKIVTWGPGNTASNTPGMRLLQWTNLTTVASAPYQNAPAPTSFEWMRIDIVAGAPTKFYVSANGTDWFDCFEGSQAGFLTYTHVGFYLYVNRSGGPLPVSGTQQMSASVMYYSDPDIVPGF
jgi:hypothetical protein